MSAQILQVSENENCPRALKSQSLEQNFKTSLEFGGACEQSLLRFSLNPLSRFISSFGDSTKLKGVDYRQTAYI